MFTIPIQIRFNDVDIFGHVNNSVYNQYLDLGRLGYLRTVLKDSTTWHGKTLVLVHIETDFRIPTFMYDQIEVQTSIYETGNKSVKMLQRIVDSKGNVKMESRSVLSTFDAEANASFILPDEWRVRIEEFENQII